MRARVFPIKAKTNHTQPCRLPEAMLLKNAPILQPDAITAPKPMSSPAKVLNNRGFIEGMFKFMDCMAEMIKEPRMTPILVRLTGFSKRWAFIRFSFSNV